MLNLKYKDKGSALHKLSPYPKLVWIISILVLALIIDHPLALLLLFLATLPVVLFGRIRQEWLSFMRFALYLCFAIIVINALVSYNGTHVLVTAPFRIPVMGTPIITLEAIFYGIGMSLRLLLIISAFAILTLLIHPDDLMLTLVKMKLPYKSVLVTTLSTRFVPTLVDDAERIIDVQRSRGLEIDKGKFVRRIKNRSSIIIILLSNSLDRAIQVAEAMESRAFGTGRGRTFFKEIKLTVWDIVAIMVVLFSLALGVLTSVSGYGHYEYYPTLGSPAISTIGWVFIISLSVLLLLIVPLAEIKQRTYGD
jgi:energy-coupling factor transport system permease protein